MLSESSIAVFITRNQWQREKKRNNINNIKNEQYSSGENLRIERLSNLETVAIKREHLFIFYIPRSILYIYLDFI